MKPDMFTHPKPQIDFTKDNEFKKIREHFAFMNMDNYADDFGHIISKKPLAIFTPPDVETLQKFLKISSAHKIKITCRGKGNSAYGQSQVEDGVIIDLFKMNISIESDSHSVTVPAFKTWYEVAEFSM